MNEKNASLPTITSEKIGTVIGDGEIVSEEGESTVSPSGAPLLDLSLGGTLESAEERHKHVPVERVPDKPCTAEHPLLTTPNKKKREKVRKSTNGGVCVSAEEVKGMELGEIAVAGLPAPGGEKSGVGFVGREAVPALEDLLAGVVVGWNSGRMSDPFSVGEIAGS